MRRIAVYRDDNQMAAQIGPDWVMGMAGFGDTVADAVRDLADWFAKDGYELRGNSVGVEVAGTFVEVKSNPGQTAPDVIRALADRSRSVVTVRLISPSRIGTWSGRKNG